MKFNSRYIDIYAVVRAIPEGRVATYGQIARIAGYGGHARLTGNALHAMPPGIDVPWHRVINSQGKISLPKEDGRYDMQKSRLEKEGIVFTNERVDLAKYRWRKSGMKDIE